MLSQSLVLNEISKVLLDRSIPNNFVVLTSQGKERKLEGHHKIKTSTEKKNRFITLESQDALYMLSHVSLLLGFKFLSILMYAANSSQTLGHFDISALCFSKMPNVHSFYLLSSRPIKQYISY